MAFAPYGRNDDELVDQAWASRLDWAAGPPPWDWGEQTNPPRTSPRPTKRELSNRPFGAKR